MKVIFMKYTPWENPRKRSWRCTKFPMTFYLACFLEFHDTKCVFHKINYRMTFTTFLRKYISYPVVVLQSVHILCFFDRHWYGLDSRYKYMEQ
jgi:hypothetical protein